ncbi:cytochrome b [Ensifer soli]|uniref:cytochrome b n=1 Tax=Ciceribacter sp. sgz301302 TaxID=3342379 RepID=UPI0035B7B7CD
MTTLSATAYSIPQRALHWAMALLILFNLIFSDGIEVWDRMTDRGEPLTPDQASAANLHAYVGIAVLVLALVRLCLRLVQGVPPAPAEEPPVLRLASTVAHWTFYALFVLMPLAGIGKYYFDNDTAGFLHAGPLKSLMWVLIVVHVAAALVHHFYWKTDVLRRMTSGR